MKNKNNKKENTMTKNYKILNYDKDTAEVVFPIMDNQSDNNFWANYEEFNQHIAPYMIEIDYDTKSYTKICFDYSLLANDSCTDKDIKKTLVEQCDYFVKFFELTKKKAVVEKQWEKESCVSRYKHNKELLSISTDSLSEYMKKGLNGLQKEEVRINKNQRKYSNKKLHSKTYWTLETYNKHLQKLIDEVKEGNIEVEKCRTEFNKLLKKAA